MELNKENFDKLIEAVKVADNKPMDFVLPLWYIEENPDSLPFYEDKKYGVMLYGMQILAINRPKSDIERKILCQEKL